MSGFTIKCNDCKSKIKPVEYHKLKNDNISVYLYEGVTKDKKDKIDVILWCEKCDNSAVFEN